MSSPSFCYDTVRLEQPKIVEDSKCCLKVNAIITKAGVYEYPDGMALKPRIELLKAVPSARSAKLVLNAHPPGKVVMSQKEIAGIVEKPFWDHVKMRAVLSFDKYVIPKAAIDKIRESVKNNVGLDVSIGFYYRPDWTPGIAPDVNTGRPTRYDYAMRDIVIDHVVTVLDGSSLGRCTFPNCGIGADAEIKADKVARRGDYWCVVHCHKDGSLGESIKCYSIKEFGNEGAKAKAEKMHRAIQARQNASAAEAIAAISKFGDLNKLDDTTYTLIFGAQKPPKEWMETCMSKAKGFADEPGAFCNWLYHSGPSELKKRFGTASSVSNKGGNQMSEETDPFEKCVLQKMEDGATRAEAEEACKEFKQGSDQNGEKTPWQKCIQRHMAEGLDKEQARMKCKEEGVKQDQETETPMQKCVRQKKAADPDMTDEDAVKACMAEGVAADQDEEGKPGSPKTLDPSEEEQPLPTPLEQCVSARMQSEGESEEAATEWCKAELAGEHTPAEEQIEAIDALLKKDRMREISKRKTGQNRPF